VLGFTPTLGQSGVATFRLAYDVQLQLLAARQKVLGTKVLWVERVDCLLAG